MPNFKIKAFIQEVPKEYSLNAGYINVPILIITSPEQTGDDIYNTLKEAKESLLAQVGDEGLEAEYIKRVTLKSLFAEHFGYVDYIMDLAGVNDKEDEPDDDYMDGMYPPISEVQNQMRN